MPITVRKDTGKPCFWRSIPTHLQPHFVGQINIPWLNKKNSYNAPREIKITLSTRDDDEALERERYIDGQYKRLLKAARIRFGTAIRGLDGLTDGQIRQIGDQEIHSILATDDRVRLGGEGSPLGYVLGHIQTMRTGKLADPHVAEAVAQKIELSLTLARLRRNDVGAFDTRSAEYECDVPAELKEKLTELARFNVPFKSITLDPTSRSHLMEGAALASTMPSDVDVALSRNRAKMREDHTDRGRLALDLARSRVLALRHAQARRRGVPVRTPAEPPIIDVESMASAKVLGRSAKVRNGVQHADVK